MGLSGGVKGCIGKFLAVELLMKTTRPDAMDVGFLMWQFGGDTCLILPILCHGREYKGSGDLRAGCRVNNDEPAIHWGCSPCSAETHD